MSIEDVRPTGWYRDPDHPLLHRYWDGGTWRPSPTAASTTRTSEERPAT